MAAFEYSSTTAFVREGLNELRAVWKCVLQMKLAERYSLMLPFQLPCKGLQDQHQWTARYTPRSSKDRHPPPISFSVCGCVVSHIALPHLAVEHTTPANQWKIIVGVYVSMLPWMTIKSKDTLSKRPGRISAGSIAFGRLVAANTIIPYKKKE